MDKLALESLYQKHHKRGSRYGYLFCHGSRIPYLQRWIGQGKKVLDLGCRDGMLTKAFASGNQVIGADIDRHALSLVPAPIETMWVDLNAEWPFEKEAFDVIVACEIMEHLYDIEGFGEKIKESLRPSGLFIGSVPNAFRVRNRWKFLLGKEYETDPTHVRQFSYEKLSRYLQLHFKEHEIVPIQGKIAPFLPVTGKTPKALGALFGKDLLFRANRK